MEEQFSAVKFQTIFVSSEPPADPKIAELKKWCREFHDRKLARPHKRGSFGNLSFRDSGDSFVITGSGVRFSDEWVDNPFVKVNSCDLEKMLVYAEGTRDPSSESLMHYSVYRARPDVGAVFHGHSREILYRAEELGLTQTITEEPYGSASLARSIIEVLDEKYLIVLKGHGFLSLGATMEDAGELACRTQDLTRGKADGR